MSEDCLDQVIHSSRRKNQARLTFILLVCAGCTITKESYPGWVGVLRGLLVWFVPFSGREIGKILVALWLDASV